MILTKGDISLRRLKTEDAQDLTNLANNKKIWGNVRDLLPHPYRLEDAEKFIKFALKKSADYHFAIDLRNEFCGVIGIHPQKDVYRKNVELGYWLGEPYWNKRE